MAGLNVKKLTQMDKGELFIAGGLITFVISMNVLLQTLLISAVAPSLTLFNSVIVAFTLFVELGS